MKTLQSPWVAGLLGLLLYAATTFMLWRPLTPGPMQPAAGAPNEPGPSWTFHNEEIDQLVTELKKEKDSLAVRAKQLDGLEARLLSERKEINQVTQHVHQLQVEFDSNVTRAFDEEKVNLKKLAKMYAAMTPEGSAAIFKQLDDSSLVKIMMFMKEAETAPILELMAKQGEP
ncbi:MAG: hypothetical protein WCO67_24785, partial [Betaproteobacteria bacterium]